MGFTQNIRLEIFYDLHKSDQGGQPGIDIAAAHHENIGNGAVIALPINKRHICTVRQTNKKRVSIVRG